MLVDDLMTPDPAVCSPDDALEHAARLLWDHDVGVVPVVRDGVPVGMLTDRDICMAAYTQGRPLRELSVASAMSKEVVVVRRGDPVDDALRLLRERQVRRLPVVDAAGKLAGILSLCDLVHATACGALPAEELAHALAAITTARVARPARALLPLQLAPVAA